VDVLDGHGGIGEHNMIGDTAFVGCNKPLQQ